jgi:hypothetical protein
MEPTVAEIADKYSLNLSEASILIGIVYKSDFVYKEFSLEKAGTRSLFSVKFRKALHAEMQFALQIQHVAAAQRVVVDLMTDTNQSARVRLDAAREIMNRAGYTPDTAPKDLDPANMTREELAALMGAIEDQLSADATDITPSAPVKTPQLVDILK